MSELWVGRIMVPGSPRERTIRVRTDAGPPGSEDWVEEIPDPFRGARPNAGADAPGDARMLAETSSPIPGGVCRPLGECQLAPPVRPGKILAVGRNFRAHAVELGNEVPQQPLLFFKPSSALLASGQPLALPAGYERIDMEGELVVVIGKAARRVPQSQALDVVAGYTLGNDVSCRDLQRRDKQWTRAKGFDGFAPLGPFVRMTAPGFELPPSARISSYIDGELCQQAPLAHMVFSIPELLAYIAECMTLEPGDLIYTGTPSGVAALSPGRVMRVQLEGFELGCLTNPVVGDVS